MEKHASVTRRRIQQFIDFRLRELLIINPLPLATEISVASYPDAQSARKAKDWQSIEPGFTWGPPYQEGWYKVSGKLPEVPEGFVPVLVYGADPQVKWETGNIVEGTIWIKNVQRGGLDHGHEYFRLDPNESKIDLLVQTYAHNRETTVHRPEKPRTQLSETFHGFKVALLDQERMDLFYDAEFALNLADSIPPEDPAHATLIRALNEVCNEFQEENRRSFARCRRLIKNALGSLSSESKHTVYAVGHAHLDTAWLWPLDVTKLKMAHTTSVQLGLAERYPGHLYAHSQASQYEWLEKRHPDLFERVKSGIKAGNWEVVGSMWVEADCNLTGAESLVRQFLYGKQYFREKLGVETVDMWLPDVFGYCAALPQILQKFNIQAFLTQKMSWNQTNKIPHNTFWWQGIDGSRIFSHFPPADTYVADCSPTQISQSVKNHRDHARSDQSLYLFGFGDGGGGPTEWHIERLKRARLAPCLPMIESKVKAKDFFLQTIEQSEDLMTWVGELYLEFHRGTYTSQALCKQKNRTCEFLLRDAELLSCFHPQFPASYQSQRLEDAWKIVLLNQFHDIIPGSSVKEVYDEAARDYAVAENEARGVITETLAEIGKQFDTSGCQNPVALFHLADAPSQGSAPLVSGHIPSSLQCGDQTLPVQKVSDQLGERLIFPVPAAARGAVALGDFRASEPESEKRLKASNRKLENDEWVVRFDQHGNITSITSLDDVPVEFIRPGQLGNLFQLLDDRPLFWDAWDTELYAHETTLDLTRSVSFEVVERGPVRVAVELVKQFGKSTIRQRISLGPTPGIRFDTWVDWHEDHKFLKVMFPLNVNTTKSTCEIQFGHVERPTHRNTTWDMAKFEVCAQKWVDLSEGGHGVALINTGKYGHDIHGSDLRLSLLRSPKAPDPTCDMGEHYFSYVLLPHFDSPQQSDVVAAAYAVNAECHVVPLKKQKGEAGQLPAFVQTDSRSLVVEAVKKSEKSRHRIVRLYECHNSRGTAQLSFALPVKQAWLCDLEEKPLNELEIHDGQVVLPYKPFEILTVAVDL
ncbi:MAG: alpha-mannosidase [Fimbriimonadaceae bacterium]|nr:alpha-mannosidase [Fimbriimonadaceae bacterium]